MNWGTLITPQFTSERAQRRTISLWSNIDYGLVLVWAVLCALGLLMVVTASISIAQKHYNNPMFFFDRQLAYLLVAVLAGYAAMRLPLSVLERCGTTALIVGIGLLVAVLIPGVGRTVNGSTRWIPVGPINFQVSELVKLLWVVYLAGFLVKRQALVTQSLKGSFVLLILLGLVAGLLLAQPDFGALFVLTSTFGFMLFLGGTRIRDFALLVICLSGLLGLLAVGAPYRMARLVAFIDPWADPFNSGFQLTQSLIAFGRGEVMGVGLGSSIQKLFYLPEAHTDFILAVWAEETGLLGVGLVMGLFGILLFKGFNVAKVADKQGMRFAALLAYGVVLLIGTAAAVNMGVVMGVLPTKGLALPFISYGGSSLLVNCIAFGLLMRVDFETRKNSVSARKKGGR